MANQVSLSIDLELDDDARLNDDSTFTNPSRGSVGVFVNGYKTNAQSQQTQIVLTGNTADPSTVASWAFHIGTDGWYQFYYVSIPTYFGGTTYAQYDAVYDNVSKLAYRSKVPGNAGNALTDALYWELLDDPATLVENIDTASMSQNIDQAVYQRILIPNSIRLRGETATAAAQECCGDCDRPEKVDQFELVDTMVEGALMHEKWYEFAAAEKVIRRLDEFVD